MADWNVPANDTHVNSVLGYIKERSFDHATLSDTRSPTPTNFPLWTKRWNATNQTFEVYSGTGWTALTLAAAGGGTGASVVSSARKVLEIDTAYNHVSSTGGVHGAVSAATAGQIVLRDGSGRAAVADPSASGDIATKNYADTLAAALSHVGYKIVTGASTSIPTSWGDMVSTTFTKASASSIIVVVGYYIGATGSTYGDMSISVRTKVDGTARNTAYTCAYKDITTASAITIVSLVTGISAGSGKQASVQMVYSGSGAPDAQTQCMIIIFEVENPFTL